VITENQLPVAKLVSGSPKKRKPRQAGNCMGMIEIVSDDDEHLSVFKDSM